MVENVVVQITSCGIKSPFFALITLFVLCLGMLSVASSVLMVKEFLRNIGGSLY